MDQTELSGFRELLDCLDSPAFLVQNGAILLRNSCAAPAVESLCELLIKEQMQLPADAAYGQWKFQFRPFRDMTLVLAVQTAQLTADAAAAHSLRTPLGDLFGVCASLLPCMEDSEDPSLKQMIPELIRNLYRLLRAVSNIEMLSAEQLSPQREVLDLCALLTKMQEDLVNLCSLAGIQLTLRTPDQPLYVRGDRQLLERALLNLLSNAIHFSSKGGTVALRLSRHLEQAVIEVENNSGEAASLEGVLDRSQAGPTEPRHGSGFGLSIVCKIARLHKGVFLFRPLDRGASAVFALPLTSDTPPTLCSPDAAVDYTGGFDHYLLELADVLPPELFQGAIYD